MCVVYKKNEPQDICPLQTMSFGILEISNIAHTSKAFNYLLSVCVDRKYTWHAISWYMMKSGVAIIHARSTNI